MNYRGPRIEEKQEVVSAETDRCHVCHHSSRTSRRQVENVLAAPLRPLPSRHCSAASLLPSTFSAVSSGTRSGSSLRFGSFSRLSRVGSTKGKGVQRSRHRPQITAPSETQTAVNQRESRVYRLGSFPILRVSVACWIFAPLRNVGWGHDD